MRTERRPSLARPFALLVVSFLCALEGGRAAAEEPGGDASTMRRAAVQELAGRFVATAPEPFRATSPDRPALRARSRELRVLLRRAEARGEDRAAIAALIALGILAEQRGQYALGMAYLVRARGRLNGALHRDLEPALLNATGVIQSRLGQFDAALEFLHRALDARRTRGDAAGEAATMANIAMAHLGREEPHAAVEAFQAALEIQRRAGLAGDMAATLAGLASACCDLGDLATGLEHLDQAEALAERWGQTLDVARACSVRGALCKKLGRYVSSIRNYERSADLFAAGGDRPGRARALLDLSLVESDLGRLDAALGHAEQAADLSRVLGDRVGEACAIRRQASVHARRGAQARAGQRLEDARRIYDLIDDPAGALWTETERANLLAQQGQVDAARVLHAAVLDRAREEGLMNVAAAALGNLGLCELRLGHAEAALKLHGQAHDLARRTGQFDNVLLSRWGLALAHWARGDAAAAQRAALRAVRDLDPCFVGLDTMTSAEGRERWAALFALGARAAAAQDDVAGTFAFVEYGRARALLDALGGRHAVVATWPADLARAEGSACERVRVGRRELRRARRGGRISELRDRARMLKEAEDTLARLRARLQREARAAQLVVPPAPDLDATRAHLRPDEALVLFVLAHDRGLAVVLTRQRARLVDLGSVDLLREACADAFSQGDGDITLESVAHLRRLLLRPLALSPEVKRLIVSPHDVLARVPFGALATMHEVSLAHSAATWVHGRKAIGRGRGVLALGGPSGPNGQRLNDPRGRTVLDLPEAAREARAVGDVAVTGAEATSAALWQHLASRPRWRALHLACHATFDAEHPLRSALLLAPGPNHSGHVHAAEFLSATLPADLVILSGCETGRGRTYAAEGLLGLTRAIQQAGASSVLCSLWKVDDAATAELMVAFHRYWRGSGGARPLSPALALQRAQAHVRAQERWRDPRYWAAWVLWGGTAE